MNQSNEETNALFRESVATGLDRQDRKIQAQDERLSTIERRLDEPSNLASDIQEIKTDIRSLKAGIGKTSLSAVKMQELIDLLGRVSATLSQPVPSEVRHHHHVPKLIWATAGLFLVVCLILAGWLFTGEKMEQYRANDYKYRYLKLFTDSATTDYLFKLDSTYTANPDSFQSVVVTQERLKQRRLELLDQIHAVDSQFKSGQNKTGERKKASR